MDDCKDQSHMPDSNRQPSGYRPLALPFVLMWQIKPMPSHMKVSKLSGMVRCIEADDPKDT